MANSKAGRDLHVYRYGKHDPNPNNSVSISVRQCRGAALASTWSCVARFTARYASLVLQPPSTLNRPERAEQRLGRDIWPSMSVEANSGGRH